VCCHDVYAGSSADHTCALPVPRTIKGLLF
jgi:hypothetical protein